jgi:hypothetical protein
MFEFVIRGSVAFVVPEGKAPHQVAPAHNAKVKAAFDAAVAALSKIPGVELHAEGYSNDLTAEDAHGLALGPIEVHP